ncbi:MAG: ABC transporter permease [Halobacteriaceae archaeon]
MTKQNVKRTILLAIIVLHLGVFSFVYTLGYPTIYVLFVILSTTFGIALLEQSVFETIIAFLASILFIILTVPLLILVARQNLQVFVSQLQTPEVHQSIYLTLYGPTLAATLSLIGGVPIAFLLQRGIPGQSIIESIIDLPLVVPHSVAGLAVLFAFGEGGALPWLSVLRSVPGMILALTFVSAPYAVNSAREALESINTRIEYAARTLGASRYQTFRKITLPLAARGIFTGGILAWARAISEFGAVAIVAYNIQFFYPPAGETVISQHAPVYIYTLYTRGGLQAASSVAILILGITGTLFVILRYGMATEGTWP